ncbi:hypothetical protein GUITHDRAFT_156314 [Guillardia theta CCMP2712]|uniref:Uncharacterized protein n=2 Tax=Guillardia theta TaxID=55529 RepID=L1I885_GUITC|nr:hypothetical protein GUITHDRAFT_156314 [Guillardia theta CCMP2712]EKX32481.1 hypothetical protein GUITHDRAFT_156314 [Guillardia theta CCMP2712]|eukprot:XP_005819461.1 hypothetical protein GUITHDRAFT_156314 [Guillardia theta CCMP2712]
MYRILVVLHLRPVWTQLDAITTSDEKALPTFNEVLQPLVNKLIGYQVNDEGLIVSPWSSSYVKICGLLSQVRRQNGLDDSRWNALCLGLANVIASETTEVYKDLADGCLDALLRNDWALASLNLWCSNE